MEGRPMAEKTWMWRDEYRNSVAGVIVDLDKNVVQWYDEPGCACTDSEAIQTIADFLERGPSALQPPNDVVDEMKTALADYAER